jgi:hypothetical protein
MSLETLRQMRRRGEVPSLVKVVVGKRNPVIDADADVVSVATADQPRHMDWRAIVGLPVALFVCEGQSVLGEQVYDAVKPAGAKLLGVAWRDKVIGADSAQPTLARMWRILCN